MRLTGRTFPPGDANISIREAWFIVGRRGGKSMTAALIAVYLTCCRTYHLAPGERGVFMIIAADRRQGGVVKRYVSGLLHSVTPLKALVARETRDAIELTNGVVIEIHTASFRTLRGYTVVGAVCDEIAFWPTDESANPDSEILAALRPAMASVPQALLVCITSPYARRGETWKAWRTHYGQDRDRVLVARAPTRTMNQLIEQRVIDEAYEADPASAAAEYGAEFRTDVETFIAREVVDAAVIPGRHELPPVAGGLYTGFLDFSGGSGGDSATCAVAHEESREDQVVAVLDAVREVRPPFSPEQVCADFAALLQTYGVHDATADRFAGEFPVEQMGKHTIMVTPCERSKSAIYREFLPRLNSGTVELLDVPRLHAQLAGLERRTARGGRDSIDHVPGGHDDVANAACGALVEVFLPVARAYGVGQAITDDAGPIVLTVADAERELARRRAARAALRTRSQVAPVGWVTYTPIEDEPGGVLCDWDPWATERPE